LTYRCERRRCAFRPAHRLIVLTILTTTLLLAPSSAPVVAGVGEYYDVCDVAVHGTTASIEIYALTHLGSTATVQITRVPEREGYYPDAVLTFEIVGPEHTLDFVGLAGQTYRVDVIQRAGDACEVTGWACARFTLKGDASSPPPPTAPSPIVPPSPSRCGCAPDNWFCLLGCPH
jgi:hypothetical protein